RLEQAHRLIEKHFGASHEMISYTLGGLGEAFRLSGDFVSAERTFEKVRTMLSAAGGDEIDLGVATFNLGEVAMATSRRRVALQRYDDALAIWRKHLPADHAVVGIGLTGRGEALIALGRAREAVEDLERAVESRARVDEPVDLARAELALADALSRTGSLARARTLAVGAAARLANTGPRGDGLRARAAKLQRRLR
ncbi:MAG: tetratricopeptide repeat protein, partial [Kofleriaceae bacterium]